MGITKEPFVIVPDRIVQHLPELTGAALKVYIAIRSHEDYRKGTVGNCFPKVGHIAEMTGLSVPGVKKGLALLKSLNTRVIHVKRSRYGNGRLGFNFYTFPDRCDVDL